MLSQIGASLVYTVLGNIEQPERVLEDRWFIGLPMDNQMDGLLMPTWFTELWIPSRRVTARSTR